MGHEDLTIEQLEALLKAKKAQKNNKNKSYSKFTLEFIEAYREIKDPFFPNFWSQTPEVKEEVKEWLKTEGKYKMNEQIFEYYQLGQDGHFNKLSYFEVFPDLKEAYLEGEYLESTKNALDQEFTNFEEDYFNKFLKSVEEKKFKYPTKEDLKDLFEKSNLEDNIDKIIDAYENLYKDGKFDFKILKKLFPKKYKIDFEESIEAQSDEEDSNYRGWQWILDREILDNVLDYYWEIIKKIALELDYQELKEEYWHEFETAKEIEDPEEREEELERIEEEIQEKLENIKRNWYKE